MNVNYKLRTNELIKSDCSSQIFQTIQDSIELLSLHPPQLFKKCFKKFTIGGVVDKYMY